MLQRAMVLSMLGVLLAAASGVVQPPGRWRGPGSFGRRGMTANSLTFLTGIPEVQKELELEHRTTGAAASSAGGFSRSVVWTRAGWRLGRGTGAAAREDSQVRRRFGNHRLRREADAASGQIRLQREGLRALVRTEIVKAIEISDAQLERIREITDSDSRGEANRQGDNPSGREPRTGP